MAYYVSGTVELGIWARKIGAWQLITTTTVPIFQNVGSLGQQTVYWTHSGSFDLGPGVEAIGVTVEGYSGISAQVADFISAQWTATQASGERSATPNGQLSTVTVRPQ